MYGPKVNDSRGFKSVSNMIICNVFGDGLFPQITYFVPTAIDVTTIYCLSCNNSPPRPPEIDSCMTLYVSHKDSIGIQQAFMSQCALPLTTPIDIENAANVWTCVLICTQKKTSSQNVHMFNEYITILNIDLVNSMTYLTRSSIFLMHTRLQYGPL